MRLPSQYYGPRPVVLSPDDKRCWPVSKRYRLGLNPNLSTRAFWPSPETTLGASWRGRRKWEFSLSIPVGPQDFFYMPWNLTTWDYSALLPIREEGVLRIFIALKNPSPWQGSNPQPLGPMASILLVLNSERYYEGIHGIFSVYLLSQQWEEPQKLQSW
jgi:hypothetical protein